MKRKYSLDMFTEEEQKLGKKFIKEALLGLLENIVDEKIDEAFDRLKDISFEGEDTITIVLPVSTIGNDLIAAMGSARRNLRIVK